MEKEKLNIDKILEGIDKLSQAQDRLEKSQEKTDRQIDKTSQQIDNLRETQKETSQQIDNLRETQKETSQQIDNLRETQKETSQQIDNLRETQKETSQQIDNLREAQKKTSQQIDNLRKAQEETNEQFKRTDKKLEEVARQLGDMGLIQGSFAEEMFLSSLLKNPVLGKIQFDIVEANVRDSSTDSEFDIVMRNGTSIGLIEVKYKARPRDLEKITKLKVQNFRQIFPEYKKMKLYFGIATAVSTPGLVAKAKKCGIFLLGQQGDHVELMNQEVKSF